MSSEIIRKILDDSEYGYVPEYQFDKHYGKRLFRADFCIPKYAILIEYEGLSFNPNQKSRHQTSLGASKDTLKYNIATCLGFTVLRYTILTLKENPFIVIENIESCIERIESNPSFVSICNICKKIHYISKNICLQNNEGYHCLTCQWIIDDRKKNKKNSK